MPRFVVVSHAHHADEGVYRLTIATVIDITEEVEIDNPDYDPDLPSTELPLPVRITVAQPATTLMHHRDVVWDAGDPKWQGRELEDVAAEQRQIVSDAITAQVAEAERAAAKQEQAHTDLGGAGTEL